MYIKQSLDVYVYQPSLVWKNDILLDAPELLYPLDQEIGCPEYLGKSEGEGTNVFLTWKPVTGAAFYLIQICNNSSFQGPTVRGIRVTGVTTYELKWITDIRVGEEYTWRVMAFDGTGGVSEKSEPRTFKTECPSTHWPINNPQGGPSPTVPSPKKCGDYDIALQLTGPVNVLCCDARIFHLKTSWNCTDAFGRDLLTFNGITWSIDQVDPFGCNFAFQNNGVASVEFNCVDSQEIVINADASFTDFNGDTFICRVSHKVQVDCDNKPRDMPWLQLNYPGDGASWYMHPDYWGPTIAPCDSMRSMSSTAVTSEYVLRPENVCGGSREEDVGDPLGTITNPHVVAIGPTVRTAQASLDIVPATPDCGVDTGKAVGQVGEARTHLAFGCGLKLSNKKIIVSNEHLAGKTPKRKGLATYGACSLQVNTGCGIKIENEKVAFNNLDVAGNGLIARDGECAIDVDYGCGLNFDGTGKLRFDAAQVLSGSFGLRSFDGYCDLSVYNGCGLDFEATGALKVKASDLAGDGLQAQGDCGLKVRVGCGLKILNGEVAIDNSTLAGTGLAAYGNCGVGLDIGTLYDQLLCTEVRALGLELVGCTLTLHWQEVERWCKRTANNLLIGPITDTMVALHEDNIALSDSTLNVVVGITAAPGYSCYCEPIMYGMRVLNC